MCTTKSSLTELILFYSNFFVIPNAKRTPHDTIPDFQIFKIVIFFYLLNICFTLKFIRFLYICTPKRSLTKLIIFIYKLYVKDIRRTCAIVAHTVLLNCTRNALSFNTRWRGNLHLSPLTLDPSRGEWCELLCLSNLFHFLIFEWFAPKKKFSRRHQGD